MAASLFALLSQQSPNVRTRKGLILTGLQNDFLSADGGKLPVSTKASGFLNRLMELVPAFREFGDIIWVRSEFQAHREVNGIHGFDDSVILGSSESREERQKSVGSDRKDDSPVPPKKRRVSTDADDRPATSDDVIETIEPGTLEHSEHESDDEELFLSATSREPCCIVGSFGAQYGTQIKDLIDKKDMQVVKTYYSAFTSTSLLLTLRSKLITELFICGCMTNLSVYATAMDAARYGIKVTLIEDCLGYRLKGRHDLAIKQLREIMEADVTTSSEVIEALRHPLPPRQFDRLDEEDEVDGQDIAPGHDSEEQALDFLEADNDEAEDDIVSPIVRPSTLSGRMLELRCVSPIVDDLPEAAARRQPSPLFEPPQSQNSQDTDNSGIVSYDSRLHDESNERGEEIPSFERLLGETTSDRLATIDDSQTEAGPEHPSRDIVHQSWEDHKTSSSKLLGRSSHPGLAAISALTGLDQATVDKYESMMKEARLNNRRASQSPDPRPLFGSDKEQESAGSCITYDLLPSELASSIFDELNKEITWQKMHHQTGEVPRLVCCQGAIEQDGSMPVYRHPSDQTLPIQSWTPAVDRVRKAVEKVVGHPLNHALIQLYRGGADYISEHSDKTLDIVKGSFIVNVSFGAQRTMRLRTKRAVAPSGDTASPARTTYRVPMPHNSMITMSLETNANYLHGINADKRPEVEISEAEKAYDGQRISLTFRNIGTFLNNDSSRIWGQGAVGKTRDNAHPVLIANTEESGKLIRAFGTENQSSVLQWDALYGAGSDVLHLK